MLSDFKTVTGMVNTKILQNLKTTSLPPTSVYIPARDIIEPAMAGKVMEDKAIDVDVYAEAFVANVLKKSPSVRYWSGAASWQVWATQRFLWPGVWVRCILSIGLWVMGR
jgi:1-acylglycerone phosphate reductase